MKRLLLLIPLLFLLASCAGRQDMSDTGAGVGLSTWTAVTEDLATDDLFGITDKSDTTGSSDGTSKKLTYTQLIGNLDGDLTIYETFCVAASDETTALTSGTAKVTFRAPWAFTLTGARASVVTAPTGQSLIADVMEGGTSVMTTNKLEIEASETTTVDATTQPTITDSAIADDAILRIDITQVGSSVAGAGLKVCLYGTR